VGIEEDIEEEFADDIEEDIGGDAEEDKEVSR